MTNKHLGNICQILARNRLAGVRLVGKSVFERELAAWINEPDILIDLKPEMPFIAPIPFEIEMGWPTMTYANLKIAIDRLHKKLFNKNK